MKNLILTKSPLMKDCFDFLWKEEIRGTLAKFDKEINIQIIESRKPNEGNCQRFIKEFKKDLESKKLKLVSSTSLSKSWTHICKKFDIKIYDKPRI